jgi:hypothetical protein
MRYELRWVNFYPGKKTSSRYERDHYVATDTTLKGRIIQAVSEPSITGEDTDGHFTYSMLVLLEVENEAQELQPKV